MLGLAVDVVTTKPSTMRNETFRGFVHLLGHHQFGTNAVSFHLKVREVTPQLGESRFLLLHDFLVIPYAFLFISTFVLEHAAEMCPGEPLTHGLGDHGVVNGEDLVSATQLDLR